RSRARALALPLTLEPAHQSHQPLIKRRVAAEAVIDAVRLLRELWQFFIELVYGESRVGAVVSLRSFITGAPACPHFTLAILWLNEQDELMLGVIRRKNGYSVRFFETGQIIEVRVLTILVL